MGLKNKSSARAEKCTSCGSAHIVRGLCLDYIPAHAVRMHKTRAAVLVHPQGRLDLVACQSSGYVFNASYDLGLHRYAAAYESTQPVSATFNVFNRQPGSSIVDNIDAEGPFIEIGLGNGIFLALLLEAGAPSVIGYDPAFSADLAAFSQTSDAQVRATLLDPTGCTFPPVAIVSKMTLEHVEDPNAFLHNIARVRTL
jgi:hypothetical protein